MFYIFGCYFGLVYSAFSPEEQLPGHRAPPRITLRERAGGFVRSPMEGVKAENKHSEEFSSHELVSSSAGI